MHQSLKFFGQNCSSSCLCIFHLSTLLMVTITVVLLYISFVLYVENIWCSFMITIWELDIFTSLSDFFTPFKCKIKFEKNHIYMWTGHIYVLEKSQIHWVCFGGDTNQTVLIFKHLMTFKHSICDSMTSSIKPSGRSSVNCCSHTYWACPRVFCTIWISQELLGLHTVWAETHQRQHQHFLTSPHI